MSDSLIAHRAREIYPGGISHRWIYSLSRATDLALFAVATEYTMAMGTCETNIVVHTAVWWSRHAL